MVDLNPEPKAIIRKHLSTSIHLFEQGKSTYSRAIIRIVFTMTISRGGNHWLEMCYSKNSVYSKSSIYPKNWFYFKSFNKLQIPSNYLKNSTAILCT